MKSILKDGWRSWETLGSDSDKVSDESMSFEIDGKYHIIRLSVYKQGTLND